MYGSCTILSPETIDPAVFSFLVRSVTFSTSYIAAASELHAGRGRIPETVDGQTRSFC